MKLKNILLFMVAGLLGLTMACTSEIPDNPAEGGSVSFTLVISTGETVTKTDVSPEEAEVTAVHVAVFDVTDIAPGDTAHAKRVATFGSTEPTYSNNVTKIDIKRLSAGSSPAKARKYFFYVIANSTGNFNSDNQFNTYAGYQAYIESTPPSALVKVGRKEVAFYWENGEKNLTEVKMDLIQLTARVEFKGIVEADTKTAGLRSSDSGFKYVKGDWTDDMKQLFTTEILQKKYGITIPFGEVTYHEDYELFGMYFYIQEGNRMFLGRVVRVTGNPQASIFSSRNGNPAFKVKSISYYDPTMVRFNGNSKITIYDTGNFENAISPSPIISPNIDKDIPFYTYETNNGVKLLITGEWTTDGSVDSEMGYLIQKTEATSDPNAWNKVSVNNYERYIPDSELTKASTSGGIEKKYVLTLPELLKGNRYEIRGTAEASQDVIPTIKWEVVDMETGEIVNIEFD